MSIEYLWGFLSPFLGVLAAFLVQRGWQRYKDGKDKQKFLQDLKKELESCSKKLVGEGNLCPMDMWNSGIASGLLKLVPREMKNELASIYFRISCHNYEATKVREVSILATAEKGKPQAIVKIKPVLKSGPPVIQTFTEMLHYQLSIRLRDDEKQLQSDIKQFLKDQTWD